MDHEQPHIPRQESTDDDLALRAAQERVKPFYDRLDAVAARLSNSALRDTVSKRSINALQPVQQQ